jgi:predicted nucleic acid-binding protein
VTSRPRRVGTGARRWRCAELERTYESLDLGLVDAAVVAVCERLGETKVGTLDRRVFGVVAPRHCERLRLLLE